MKRRSAGHLLVAVVAVLCVAAASCGDSGSDTSNPATTASGGATPSATTLTPKKGGSLSIADKAEIATLDPVKVAGSSSTGANQAFAIFDSLLINDTKTGKLAPQLAASFDSTDAKVWTLKLRPNVKFSDGTPLDAAAVVFNWKRLQDAANASPNRNSANQISAMDIIDATTLKVTLAAPNAGFANLLTDRLGFIGSPTAIQANPTGFGTKPVGAGPFVLKSWVRDDRMTLTRNPTYWNAPQPYLDELVYRVIIDGTQRERSFEAKELTVNRTTAPADLSAAKKVNASVTTFNSNLGTVLLLNHRTAPFNDISVREAMDYAFDPVDVNAVLNDGSAPMITSLFAPGSPWRVDSLKISAYNKAEAQRLFDAYKTKTGSALSFKLTVFQNPESQAFGQYFQAKLNQYGVKVDLDVGQSAAVVDAVGKGTYTAVHWNFPVGPDPEPIVYETFNSKSTLNRFGYSNATVDAALDAARATTDPDARKKAYQTVQEQVLKDHVSVWLWHGFTAYIHRPEVNDLALSGDGIVLSDRVWLST
jgi:peptide/nickel transport system substrate-binding protein